MVMKTSRFRPVAAGAEGIAADSELGAAFGAGSLDGAQLVRKSPTVIKGKKANGEERDSFIEGGIEADFLTTE